MERVRMGIIGFGCRAYGMMDILMGFEDVDIVAVCDKYEDRRDNAKNRVIEKKGNTPFATTDYRELLAREDVDAVYIATDWEMHFPIAIDSMRAGKAVALEVGGAYCV